MPCYTTYKEVTATLTQHLRPGKFKLSENHNYITFINCYKHAGFSLEVTFVSILLFDFYITSIVFLMITFLCYICYACNDLVS